MADLATTMTVIDACGRAGVPVLLKSDPGKGKSSLVRDLADAQAVPCETVLGSIREPADVAGLPVVTDDGVVLDPPAWARRLVEADAGYLFLDELTTCPGSVQAAMLAVALERTVGDLRLPDSIRIVAGANDASIAAGGYELSAPLANRFCHVDFDPSADEWIDGMLTGWGKPPASRAIGSDKQRATAVVSAVTGFIRSQPTKLYKLPTDASASGGAWPSNRTWSMLSRALQHVRDDDHGALQAIVFGLVGEGVGVEFLEWRRKADLPDPATVLADPSSVDWADDRPDRIWAILGAVVHWAGEQKSIKAWTEAWRPLEAAALHGAPDVAAAAARLHARNQPAKARIPASAQKAFQSVLVAAGLSRQEAAA